MSDLEGRITAAIKRLKALGLTDEECAGFFGFVKGDETPLNALIDKIAHSNRANIEELVELAMTIMADDPMFKGQGRRTSRSGVMS